MKKLLLTASLAALTATAANAAPTLYGKAFLTLDVVSTEADGGSDDTSTALNSNSSRIGLKGKEALTNGLSAVYKLEYGINVDTQNVKDTARIAIDNVTGQISDVEVKNKNSQFYSRDTYLGIASDELGTLVAGRLTTIDDEINYASILEGSNIADLSPSFDGERADNAFAYISPETNGVTLMAMYGLDSDQDAGGLDNEDQYGVGVKYETDMFNAGASYIGHDEIYHFRASGSFAVAPEITLGALYQMSDYDTDDNENSIIVSGEMATATPWTAYAQVSMFDNVGGADNTEAMGVGAGGIYKFSKAALGHLYGGYVTTEEGSVDTDGFGVGAGLEYKF